MAWSTWRDHDCDGKGFSRRKIRKPDGLFRRNLRLDLTCSSAAGRSGGGAVSAELGRPGPHLWGWAGPAERVLLRVLLSLSLWQMQFSPFSLMRTRFFSPVLSQLQVLVDFNPTGFLTLSGRGVGRGRIVSVI